MSNPVFKTLTVRGWRQFGKIDLDFHRQLTILTGRNGTGKSTLLKILAGEFAHSWTPKFAATAVRVENRIDYSSGASDEYRTAKLAGYEKHASNRILIGSIVQTPGNAGTLLAVPKQPQNQYGIARVEISLPLKRLYGLYLPSHRINATYAHIAAIPTHPYSTQFAFSESVNCIRIAGDDFASADLRSPHEQRKQALIAMNSFPMSKGEDSGIDIIATFDDALRKLLPTSIQFRRLDFRGAEVVFETGRGDFAMDSLSGGLESLVDLIWQCSLLDGFAENFVVLLDEPENHLHPEMQRTILPDFMASFPHAQFIVATHNPLIATSVENSNLYFLDYEDNGTVQAHLIADQPKSGTSDETLREFFGVATSMPIWVQRKIAEIQKKFEGKKLTESTLKELRKELEEVDLDEYIPDTLVDVVQKREGTQID